MNKLHPGAIWIFRFKGYSFLPLILGLMILPTLKIISFLYFSTAEDISLIHLIPRLLIFIAISLFIGLGLAEIFARMSYNRYLYEINHDGIKIEKGIIWKKYTLIPFARIQNVDIRRGIFAQMFGFSGISIQTAGNSGIGEAEGDIPAVYMDDAEKIRDFIVERLKG